MQELQVRSLGWEDPLDGGHGNLLRYSCLENLMDRGAWRAKVHRVTKSWTRLKWLSVHACVISWFLLVKNLGMVFLGVLLLGHSKVLIKVWVGAPVILRLEVVNLQTHSRGYCQDLIPWGLLDLSYRSLGCWPGTSLGPLPHESLYKQLTTCQPGSSKTPSERTREKRVPTRQVP